MMKKTSKLSAIFISFISLSLSAQTVVNHPDPKPYIFVTGTAEQEIIPNEIFIGINISERQDGKHKLSIEEQEHNLKSALKEANVDISQFYLTDAVAHYNKSLWESKDVWTSKEYTLKVSDAETVGRVYSALEKLDIREARIDRVHHSKMDSLRQAVNTAAIQAAKNKADYLLAAVGSKTGRPLEISEQEQSQTSNSYQLNLYREYRNMDTRFSDDKIPETQFSKIKLRAGMNVKFEIEP